MDSPEQWRWLWLVAAAVFAIGEMATPGSFFLAPFAVGAFVASLLAFVVVELRMRNPLIDPRLFANRSFSASNAVSLLTGYTLATAISASTAPRLSGRCRHARAEAAMPVTNPKTQTHRQ